MQMVFVGGGIVLLFTLFLIIFMKFDVNDIEHEAIEEAHNATDEEIREATHPNIKTEAEIVEENKLLEEK